MISRFILLFVTAAFCIQPAVYTDKLDAIPDYYQADTAYGALPGGGAVYCGPTAASNGLLWLSDNGFPDLAPATADRKKDQFDLIETLGSADYMNVGTDGIGPWGFCVGLNGYIAAKGYAIDSLVYRGWRPTRSDFHSGDSIPDFDWTKNGILEKRCCFLNFGWYTYNAAADTYTRTGGHWVTLAGYGHNGTASDTSCLVVHEPATRLTFNDYLVFEKITTGTLAGDYTNLPRSAAGYYKVSYRSQLGIMGGVVVLALKENPTAALRNVRAAESPVITVSPNPFTLGTRLNIDYQTSNSTGGGLQVSIYGIDGSLVDCFDMRHSRFDNHPSIPWQAADLPAGTYLIEVKAGAQRLRKKAVLVK